MRPQRLNLASLVRQATITLKEAGVHNAVSDAKLIAAEVLGVGREDLLREPDLPFNASEARVFNTQILRRANREPLSRILGRREFRSLEFKIGPHVLDPRPDSEVVVETAIDLSRRVTGPIRVLDIGTGSGCLLLSILDVLPTASGVGTDVNDCAIENAIENARCLGFSNRSEFRQTFWTEGVTEKFDIIVSNPPYVRTQDIGGLAPEVADFDPIYALDGGVDGLTAYWEIAVRIPYLLRTKNVVVLEIGEGQRKKVESIFTATVFRLLDVRLDLAGHERCLAFST